MVGKIDRRSLRILVVVGFAGLALGGARARAQEPGQEERIERLEQRVEELRRRLAAQDTSRIAELRRQIEAITRELEELRLGSEVVTADRSVYGFGPAASKVYRVSQGVSIGGYGEVLYENFQAELDDGTPSGATDQIDALRAIVYVGYKFNDRILFNSELEFEHGSTGQAGSVSVEFAYLDYLISEELGLRAGLLLPPMGFLNELHEPPTFLGTERPVTEQRIIPSTWRENGIGLFGEVGNVEYRAYLINGLDGVGGGSSNAGGFSGSGLRGGRQKGSKAVAEDFAGVARVDYTGVLGLTVGTSVYLGESGQNNVVPDSPMLPERAGERIGARTLIWEGHAEYRARGLDLRGLIALADLNDVAELNVARGLSGAGSIGERMIGGYVQVGYDVLRRTAATHQLIPYVRYERIDTQEEVPAGFAANPANDMEIISLGAAWKPIPNLVFKADYQVHDNAAGTGLDQWNAAVGYLF